MQRQAGLPLIHLSDFTIWMSLCLLWLMQFSMLALWRIERLSFVLARSVRQLQKACVSGVGYSISFP